MKHTSEMEIILTPMKIAPIDNRYEQVLISSIQGNDRWLVGACDIDDLFYLKTAADGKVYDRLWRDGEEVKARLIMEVEDG